ncbi:MAG: hypothetical protein UT39_C0001G0008 [Candidatus Woesebacteria bacterium GW2011_GWA1_39_21]|uniref:Uncharacterized protein n=1 Tax=Candidatus Woesebacteria bacterium GW2011_GWA1_39_21 TaxID=1618550 RepID=A0A0G0N911_9BACT|nr:MAG: hypothetical protein UT39_C0001G0008 [Candidatus Woesebacteria bacterium GW2011_GWA1_39_21]
MGKERHRKRERKAARIEFAQNNGHVECRSVEIDQCGDCSHIISDVNDKTKMTGCDICCKWRAVNNHGLKCRIAELEYKNGVISG